MENCHENQPHERYASEDADDFHRPHERSARIENV
jgi:hypothetical protein